MDMRMDWVPTLEDRPGPVYRRIADAMAGDIADGRLRRGQQLPTHRALAKALGIDLTTVTRAYAEARRRGLTEARTGLGTFVAESLAQIRHDEPPWTAFDLSMNLPPQPIEADLEGRITRGVAAIAREIGFSACLNYREPGGSAEEREAAAAWLGRRLPGVQRERIVICPGTQSALHGLITTLASRGDVVLTEALTYPGMKAAAAHAGLRLVGVPTDAGGILPDALRTACRRYKPKAVYLIPTIHNPTTVTMPRRRCEEVARVLRECDVQLIEDDAYGALAPEASPLAAFVPERTHLAASLAKCIAPGLRVSIVAAPDRSAADTLTQALRATLQMPVALMIALVTRWLRDGSADAIIGAIRDEGRARQQLAAKALAGQAFAAHPNGHHVWIELPRQWTRPDFAAHVQRQGLAVVASDAFSVANTAPHAIRVALGAAASRHELVQALNVLAAALRSPASAARIV
jgi:DNA-binding transcriptional MocR family regulator